MSEHTIVISEKAEKTISNMRQRVAAVAAHYGETSEEYLKVLESFAGVMLQMIRLGGQIVSDGDIELAGLTKTGLEYHLIWHRKLISGAPNYERDPLLGEWSSHS